MLLAVFSDSHGRWRPMCAAVEATAPDAVLYLGDGLADLEKLRAQHPALPVYAVRGNCDGAAAAPDSRTEELGGVRLFLAHGHLQGVKWNMESFANSVHFSGAQLGLYGHTHRARYQELGGLCLLNPGSIGSRQSPTYALIEIKNGAFQCRIQEILPD